MGCRALAVIVPEQLADRPDERAAEEQGGEANRFPTGGALGDATKYQRTGQHSKAHQ